VSVNVLNEPFVSTHINADTVYYGILPTLDFTTGQ